MCAARQWKLSPTCFRKYAAYGEGFLVAEQIPSKLALDVIKNTNLKVVHRIVAGDDRKVLGDTMNMEEQQCEMLSTLRLGQAAVFAEGDDRPILVAVPYSKITVPAGDAYQGRVGPGSGRRDAGFPPLTGHCQPLCAV